MKKEQEQEQNDKEQIKEKTKTMNNNNLDKDKDNSFSLDNREASVGYVSSKTEVLELNILIKLINDKIKLDVNVLSLSVNLSDKFKAAVLKQLGIDIK